MKSENFNYEYALVCRTIPNSLINGLSLSEHKPVDLELAKIQHENYLNYLRESNVKLIEIEPNENYPDCVFVEDTAIAVDNRILITNPGAESRRGETEAVRLALNKHAKELNLKIMEISDKAEAFIDGGDCCFTGRELIIGCSTRTNLKGIEELKKAFSDINVITCKVSEGLHLKSSMTMFCQDVIIIGKSAEGSSIRDQIINYSTFAQHYRFVEVDEDEDGSANVLFFNGRLLYPASFEHLYKELEVFQQLEKVKSLENGEFKKIDGCLTCRSIFFNSK